MKQTYEMTLAGCRRQFPICKINDYQAIVSFVVFSDVELTRHCVQGILQKAPDFDVILTAETKGITFAYEMSAQSGKPFLLARKMKKLYMENPVEIDVRSITTVNMQRLVMDKPDLEKMRGKRVLIFDDVVSTGNSLNSLQQIVRFAGGEIAAKATILAEGDAKDQFPDLIYLDTLPILEYS